MTLLSPSAARRFAIVAAVLAWAGLLIQLYCTITLSLANGKSLAHAIVLYFIFFTILTNILVALALTLPLIASRSSLGEFFSRPGVNTAIAVYIVVVGLIYNLVLRQLWNPQGWQLVADTLLHQVTPVLFLLYWWLAIPKESLRWTDVLPWSRYPLGYCFYALAHGAVTGFYPYPFLNAADLGLTRVLINALVILVGFLMLAGVMIAAGRRQRA